MHCSCFLFKQRTAYEMRISDWSSDVCSSDLQLAEAAALQRLDFGRLGNLDPISRHLVARKCRDHVCEIGALAFQPLLLRGWQPDDRSGDGGDNLRGVGCGDRKSTRLNSSH